MYEINRKTVNMQFADRITDSQLILFKNNQINAKEMFSS